MEAVLPPESPSSEDHQRKCLKNIKVAEARDTVNKSSEKGKVARKGQDYSIVELARKPCLTEEDVKCPICWSILYEPTTLPCKHSLCMSCYLKHAEETSLYCPCCRRRLSIWSRKAKKQNELLDKKLWSRLKIEFPNLIQARINGDELEDLLSDNKSCSQPNVRDGVMSSAPGVIFAELKQVLKPHQDDLENERLRTEVASINLIKQIEQEERKLLIRFQEREHQDFILATQLHEELNFGAPHEKPLRKSTRVRRPCQKLSNDFVETLPSIVTRRIPIEEKLNLKPVPPMEKERKKMQQSSQDIRIASTPAICSSSMTSNQSEAVKIGQIKSTDILTVSCSPSPDESSSFSIQKNRESCMDIHKPEQKYNSASMEPFSNNLPLTTDSSDLSYAAAKILCMLNPEDEVIPPSDNEDEDYRSSALKQAEVTLREPERAFNDEDSSVEIDYEEVVKEADAVAARYQEQADRAFAELVQRKIKWGIDEGRGKDSEEKYSLRAWKRTRMSENV